MGCGFSSSATDDALYEIYPFRTWGVAVCETGCQKEVVIHMVRVGIIGMGIRGRLFFRALGQNPYARVVAVCDANESTLAALQLPDSVALYTDFRDLVARNDVDAVVVATPDMTHKEPVVRAAERGKHILVEKPFATNVEEAYEMAAAVRSSGVKCLVGFENRWNAPFACARQAVSEGQFGSLLSITAKLNDTVWVPTTMLSWAAASSPGWFLMSHLMDLTCWLANDSPVRVQACGVRRKLVSIGLDTWDCLQALVQFASGACACLSTSWVLPESMPTVFDGKMEIIGTKGAIAIDLVAPMVSIFGNKYQVVPMVFSEVCGKIHGASVNMVDSFIEAIENNMAPLVPLEDAVLNTRLVAAVHRAAQTNEPVSIS